MAINASKYKRSISCRYCNADGHSVQHCPQIPVDGARAQEKVASGQVLNYMENYALQRWQKNQEIATARSNRTTPQRPKKCGFCATEGHNRRQCAELLATKKLLHNANKVWRAYWAKMATEYGFAPASLINIKVEAWYTNRYNMQRNTITLVGNQMPENLTIFAIADDYDMRQEINIPLTNVPHISSLHPKCFRPSDSNYHENAFCYLSRSYGWMSIEGIEVLSKSTYVYPQEWIEAYPKDIDYAVKKWNKAKLGRLINKVQGFVEYADYVHDLSIDTITQTGQKLS
jgi:hypothetical protein